MRLDVLRGAAFAPLGGQKVPDTLPAVAVRGQSVKTHGLVGGREDAEEGEDDAAVPGCADGPGFFLVFGEDVGPGAGRGENAGEEGGLLSCH